MTDVLVIGAGPAGMSAALELQARGLEVTVADDQPAPGGRIFANIEKRSIHSAEDRGGAALVRQFRSRSGSYLSGAEVWQIEPGPRVFLTRDGHAQMLEPRFVLFATGAQERPMPFPGWQLPGVMTIGAAQILLKTASQIPDEPVWLAGTGPLLLLYANQLIAAGGSVAGIFDTTPPGRRRAATRLLIGALGYGWRDMLRGLYWMARLRGIRIIRDVVAIEGLGSERLTAVRYRTRGGERSDIPTKLLLVHDGVIPAVHGTFAADCDHRWNAVQKCFEPVLDRFGRSTNPAIFVAGDGASINGARAARLSGRLAAVGIARAAGRLSEAEAELAAAPLRRDLSKAARFRSFIDALHPPVNMPIPDDAMVCRCEEVSADDIRIALQGRPELGSDGAKICTRAGMGPCQARQCGLSITRLVAEVNGDRPEQQSFLRIRPPLKPLTLGELAELETGA